MKKTTKEFNYSKSITKLYASVKEILIKKVQEKEATYTYKTISDLKEKAVLYLPTELQSYAIALYGLVMYPRDEAYEYNILLSIYNDLK